VPTAVPGQGGRGEDPRRGGGRDAPQRAGRLDASPGLAGARPPGGGRPGEGQGAHDGGGSEREGPAGSGSDGRIDIPPALDSGAGPGDRVPLLDVDEDRVLRRMPAEDTEATPTGRGPEGFRFTAGPGADAPAGGHAGGREAGRGPAPSRG